MFTAVVNGPRQSTPSSVVKSKRILCIESSGMAGTVRRKCSEPARAVLAGTPASTSPLGNTMLEASLTLAVTATCLSFSVLRVGPVLITRAKTR
eukprot:10267360-Heterocapsa_arctica.AAC.1